MTYDAFDVVVVPFPFTDRAASKRRPALVLSRAGGFNEATGHSVLAMITSANNDPWALDAPVVGLDAAGLPSPSVVRMKLFTLDHRLILRKTGQLSQEDRITVVESLNRLLALD